MLETFLTLISWNSSFSVLIPDRPFSYTKVEMDNVNVILNYNDVSEYLKISPNGVEVIRLKSLQKTHNRQCKTPVTIFLFVLVEMQ